ncbi:MAG: hypothetical protein AAF604_18560 [Acidobacteriota bacterium]
MAQTYDIASERERVLGAVSDAADAWGAEWQRHGTGGRLVIPLLAGIRVGFARGEVSVQASGDSSVLRFDAEETQYRLQTPAVMILIFSAFGASLTVLWPFFPSLLPMAPVGAILALGGWFLVVSRLQTNTPEDFFGLVREMATDEQAPDEDALRAENS